MNPIDAADAAWRRAFDQGFICALVTIYGSYPSLKCEVIETLRVNGFRTLDEAMGARPDEYDAGVLREIYGVD